MRLWLCVMLLAAVAAGRGRKHRHQKPGRAVLDRLASSPVAPDPDSPDPESPDPGALEPLDVAPFSVIAANSTCGQDGAEEYCRDTPGKRGVVCDVCEGPSGPPARRHPPSHALDGDAATWWQSAVGQQHVALVVTLPDEMELTHIIIKSGPSPRPLAWSLEVSRAGEDWRLISAFGDREHCRKLWDLRPERRRRKARGVARRADKPTCSTQFSSPRPLENGEMHVRVPEAAARLVRISFRAPHAAAPAQYYSVRALAVVARCRCQGRARRCHVDDSGAKCQCLDGCGKHCEPCCADADSEACAARAHTECACSERGACSYDETGAILCVNCTDNRAGPLCDRCLAGYYSPAPDGPCVPCDCHSEGSDGSCTSDRKHKSCSCLPGYTGSLCDACVDLAAEFPSCLVITTPACKCDPRGVVDPERVCDDVCECKENVVGERCDACAAGHFGLRAALAAGCRPCYCSRVADACAEDPERGDNMVFPLGEAWLVTDIEAKEMLEPSVDENGKPYLISYDVEGWDSFYWSTTVFNGEQLSSYGGEVRVRMFFGVVRGDTGGNPTTGPDAVLVAADGTKLFFSNRTHEIPGEVELSIPLVEDAWLSREGPLSRHQFLDALSDLKMIMIRAHFHMDQDEIRLDSVELQGAAPGARERCACPAGYGGAQCGACAWTHARRARVSAPAFECVPCACNGHATCETVEGPCGTCQHNTTGPHCERCLPGHYGNPVQGACRPCACPLYIASNNFSPNCALASSEGDEFVCTQCPDGYTGDHCEHCDFGYWGDPMVPGGSCQPCDCAGAPCDPGTGACRVCPPHSEGARCDQCQEGYYATEGGCAACGCGRGALAAACAGSGACACRSGWQGRACDQCAPGHGGLEAGCPACRCGVASLSDACDAATGACACAPGAAPPSCDNCLDEHYGLTAAGCSGCNCSALGAENNVCDIRTGQCRCRPHVTGRACDTCEEGYWGLRAGGCRRCACGAGAAACDPASGACACARGVGGAACDRCLPGYYGFGVNGCLPCPACTDGKVCSPDNGRCVCPARTRGPGCRLCAPGHWARAAGCRRCTCGPGAVADTCDPLTGDCTCRDGWSGARCDVCAPGHFGPRCRPCLCHPDGSANCSADGCPCDAEGRCSCKVNVEGEKCDRCRAGTFGLAASPNGCTECFCFGRSAHCTQAGLTRAALHAAAPAHITLLMGDSINSVDQDSLIAIHTHSLDSTISLPWPPVPVYMELDKRFLGDRVTSYGGLLRFRVEEEGGEELGEETLARFPLVRLYGKDIVLDYYERVPAVNNTHVVRLHESLWRVRGPGVAATRAALMLALRRVQRILLRTSSRRPSRDDRVHALLLNVSLDTAIPGISRSKPALGVELCSCPAAYSAPSCHEPAVGFWMPPLRVHLDSVSGTIVIRLEGDAQPCSCNGRAVSCDPDTGDCLNCTQGTAGPRCERCAEGHYGSPAAGCQACPCPTKTRNFASACVFSGGRLQCLCKPGYTGPECESCAPTYYRAAGACAPCACDETGAADARCDARGRCRCRAFATGRRCDQCRAPRLWMDGGGCRDCDNCTQTLLDSVEHLAADLKSRADLTELGRIPQPFPALREFEHNTSLLRNQLAHLTQNMERPGNLESEISTLEADEHRIFTLAFSLKEDALEKEEMAKFLSLESMSSLEEALKQRQKLGETVATLDDFAIGERHLGAHRAIKEARHLLRNIKNLKLNDYIAGANDVYDAANLQSTSIQELSYSLDDAARRLGKLQASFEAWHLKSDDLARLADRVWAAGDRVAALEKDARPRMAAARDTALRCRLVLEDIETLSNHSLPADITAALLSAPAASQAAPALAAELASLALAAEEKEGILYSLTPAYREKYLDAVERHVQELGVKATEYKSLFAGTRALASAGVTAARAWAEVAETVRSAADAAAGAAHAVAAARELRPMMASADHARAASGELKARGAAVLSKAEELRRQLEHLRRGADAVSVLLRGLGWRERGLGERPGARVADVIAAANEQAERVFATTRALYDEASEARRRVRYALRRQLAELARHGDTALGGAQEHVSQINGNMLRGAEAAAALAAAAAARGRERAQADAARGPRDLLADKIARAKHAADSISVSLASGVGGCARAWAARGAGAAGAGVVARAALAVSFDDAVPDGPLLRLVTQDNSSHLTLEVRGRRFHLSWSVGGAGELTHPEVLEPVHDDADHNTYTVDIERVWNTVRLTVERAGAAPSTASNTSGAATPLAPARLWLGGAGGLPGCVHALHLDGRRLGLWNFLEQPADAKCTACTQRRQAARGPAASLAWFNGAGYAELRRSRSRPADARHFSVAFTVRTRDANALLFMAVDRANNRSISVRMRDCRIVFLVQYASARLELAARGQHCRGRAVHVQAARVLQASRLERGSLRVNGEEFHGSPEPPVRSAAELPELAGARYWAGGAPPGAGARGPALLGCLGALAVDREGYDVLDTTERFGVEEQCMERTLRSATLEGAGYIELASPALRRRAALGLTFASARPSGLLLLRAPDDDDDGRYYLRLALVDGALELSAAAGGAELQLRGNGSRLDDGAARAVRVVRAHKQLELWVDEQLVGRGALAGAALPAREGGLFVGGAPAARGAAEAGFRGTLADLVVDGSVIGFETALNWSGASLGRAARAAPPPPPPARAPALCTKTASYAVEAGAVKFGDTPASHAVLRLPRAKDLALTLQLRTFASDGLLLLAPGTKLKPKHYLALLIREGKLRLLVRGRRRKELALPTPVNDGEWRSVSIRLSHGRAALSSGGGAVTARAAPAQRAPRLYVGAAPRAQLPHVPSSIFRPGGFIGCVRRVTVGARAQDLARAAAGRSAGQCFPHVQRGAYFGGDAHALWAAAWARGAGELRLRFRSVARAGLLLAAGPLALQLRAGALVLTRTSGSSTSRAETRGAGNKALCDDAWHAVVARVSAAHVSLSLDGGPEIRSGDATLVVDDLPTAAVPVYIGGLPEGSLDTTEGRENFRGCIDDVTIGGEARRWQDMEALHNVLLDSCPVAQ